MVTETAVLSSLIYNEEYARKVMPFLDREYFPGLGQQVVFKLVKDYFLKYNKIPSKDILQIEIENSSLSENVYDKSIEVFEELQKSDYDLDWLMDSTEKWCQRQALFNAISKSASLIEEPDNTNYGKALELVQDAMAVGFDHDVGHDYIEDAMQRSEMYKEKLNHLECGLNLFDLTTKGGFVSPSLVVFMAPSGVGKSFMLCQLAASYLTRGKNVLYITLEMSTAETAKRIDANLLKVSTDDLETMETSTFMNRMKHLRSKTLGKLIIKEYPARTAHSGHFRHAIRELKIKKNFVPDVLLVDYLGIMDTARGNPKDGLFEHGKHASIELRSLGQEFKLPVFSAVQVNREGTKNGDFDITDIAESWAIVANADYVYGMVTNDDLARMNQMMIKRLKDRYNNYQSYMPRFNIGIDYTFMRFYNLMSDGSLPASERTTTIKDDPKPVTEDIQQSRFATLNISDE